MDKIYEAFLNILNQTLKGAALAEEPGLSPEEWQALLVLASDHDLLGFVYDAVCNQPSFRNIPAEVRKPFQERAVASAMREVVQTNEFLTLLLHLQEKGLDPAVLKGIICRSLYPKPLLRPSVDEDLLAAPEDRMLFHEALLAEGFTLDEDVSLTDEELSYHKPNSPSYIELHQTPFPSNAAAYADCNTLFEGALSRTVRVQIEDVSVRTLSPSDHLLFLLCHAYKHFLHSGVGIRQVCDIVMFVRKNETEINWDWVYAQCRSISIEKFAAALFCIGKTYLGLETEIPAFQEEVDPLPLLEDILSGGLYGINDENRLHSSTITLSAVAAEKQGTSSNGYFHTLFPPYRTMARRYPYVKRCPLLLPISWGQRFVVYVAGVFKVHKKNRPSESIRIGRERVELLKEYGIIERKI